MERSWQVVAPVDGVEKYARIQRHAAGQQERGGGQKDSRKRQSEDGFEQKQGTAAVGGEVSEFRTCLFYKVLMKAQTDSEKMNETIENMNVDRQITNKTQDFAGLLALGLAGSGKR